MPQSKYTYPELLDLQAKTRDELQRQKIYLETEVFRIAIGASSTILFTGKVRHLSRRVDRLATLLHRISFALDEAAYEELVS